MYCHGKIRVKLVITVKILAVVAGVNNNKVSNY